MPRSAAAAMFYSMLAICILATTFANAQVAYSRALPYDPRYLLRRIPVRRSAEADARLRLPITRYFPQVDTQVASAPYVAAEPMVPATYQLANGEMFAALPKQWPENMVSASALERNDDEDYDAYDYDNEFRPVYAQQVYPGELYAVPQEIEPQETEGDLYNDLMVNYILGEMQPRQLEENDFLQVQRRNQGIIIPSANQITVDNRKMNESNAETPGPAPPVAPKTFTAVPATSPPVVSASSTPAPVLPQNIAGSASQTTSGLAMRSLPPAQNGLWRDFDSEERGQKEFPLYRPSLSGHQRQAASAIQGQLSRAKNSMPNKNALPVIEKLMAAQRGYKDPLTEQLDNLKFRNM